MGELGLDRQAEAGPSAGASAGIFLNLAERAAEIGRRNDAQVLAALAQVGDGGLDSGDVASSLALAERTVRAAIDRLQRRGLVARQGARGRVFATMAGRGEAGADMADAGGVDLLPALKAAIDCFPTHAQRAFLRLLLSGVVARHHLAHVYPDGWGAFIALGPTQTGKTSLARVPCKVFGLSEIGSLRMLPEETPGSVYARRERTADGWHVAMPTVLGQAFVCFDEWDKAEPEVRKQAGQLLMGSVMRELEGTAIDIRPTVMVCLNTGPEGLKGLSEAYVRRAVVIDTAPLQPLLTDIDLAMRRLFRNTPIPRLQLPTLRPPAEELTDGARAVLRTSLQTGLTAEGWHLCDVEALSRTVLGRAALAGDADQKHAALTTALDYLAVASTTDHTVVGWASKPMADVRQGGLTPDGHAAEAEGHRGHRARVQKEADERKKRLDFVAARERSAQTVLTAKLKLRSSRDPDARGIAAALTGLAKNIRGARRAEELDEICQAADPWLEQAEAVRRAREASLTSARERREADKRARLQTTAAKRSLAYQQAQERRDNRREWISWRKSLTALIPAVSSADLMEHLKQLRLVEWVPPPAAPPGASLWDKTRHALSHYGHYVHLRTQERTDWSDAPRIWLDEWRLANHQVVLLGGRAANVPTYRERPSVRPRSTTSSTRRRAQRSVKAALKVPAFRTGRHR